MTLNMEMTDFINDRMKYMFRQVWMDKQHHYHGDYYLVPVWFAYGKILDVFVLAIDDKPAGIIANFDEHLEFYADPASDRKAVEEKMRTDEIWK